MAGIPVSNRECNNTHQRKQHQEKQRKNKIKYFVSAQLGFFCDIYVFIACVMPLKIPNNGSPHQIFYLILFIYYFFFRIFSQTNTFKNLFLDLLTLGGNIHLVDVRWVFFFYTYISKSIAFWWAFFFSWWEVW